VQRGQRGRRAGAQFVRQPGAGLLEHPERGAGLAGGGQRAHQRADQRLTQGIGRHQALQLGDQRRGRAEPQVRVDPVLDRGQPPLGQPGDRRGGEIGIGHVGQSRAAPQGQCLAQQVRGPARVIAQRGVTVRGQPLELDHVDLAGVEHQLIAGRVRSDHRLRQRSPQPGHQGLQRVRRRRGELVLPQRAGQPARRHDPAGVQREQDQQRAQPGAAHLHQGSCRAAHLEGTKQRDKHSAILLAPGCASRSLRPAPPAG